MNMTRTFNYTMNQHLFKTDSVLIQGCVLCRDLMLFANSKTEIIILRHIYCLGPRTIAG